MALDRGRQAVKQCEPCPSGTLDTWPSKHPFLSSSHCEFKTQTVSGDQGRGYNGQRKTKPVSEPMWVGHRRTGNASREPLSQAPFRNPVNV